MKTVLIIDDSATERFTLECIMKAEGWEVLSAAGGEEGLKVAKEQKPDLILMDVVMPGTNGYQATREISRSPDTKGTPVIICTSRGAETDKVWGMRQGAEDYLVKPITKEKLIPVVERAMAKRG